MIDKYRNPDGTYNGIGVLSELSGLNPGEVRTIAEKVKANNDRLNACPYHDFEPMAPDDPGIRSSRRERYRCTRCGGEIDASAYHWHETGRRGRQ